MAFSPDGKLMASGSRDKTVRISQVSDGSLVREFKVRDPVRGWFCCVVCTVVLSFGLHTPDPNADPDTDPGTIS